MSKASKETTPITMDFEIAEDRSCQLEGFTVNFVTIRQDPDLAPMLAEPARRHVPLPALGRHDQGSDDGALCRSRRSVRSRRRVLHAAGTHPAADSRHGVHSVQPHRPARRDRGSDRQGDCKPRPSDLSPSGHSAGAVRMGACVAARKLAPGWLGGPTGRSSVVAN